MAEYVPLVDQQQQDGSSSVQHEQLDYADIDLEKSSGPLPKWYQQLPNGQMFSKWSWSWKIPSRRDIPDARTCLSLFLAFLLAALPRFLRPGGLRREKKLHPTSYLDALRGWASIFVARYHMYQNRTWIFEQHVIRAILNGRAMVDLFFVISGYVLTYRLLKLIRTRQPGLLKAIASSSFRRWLRLYGSTGVATFVTAIIIHLGYCKGDLRQPTWFLQFYYWGWDLIMSSNPFGDIKGWWYGGVFRTAFLDQMWTIPVEFRGSMLVFWFCAASAFLTTRSRRVFALFIIYLLYAWGCIWGALFMFGMLLADYQFDRFPERLQRIQLPQQDGDGGPPAKPKDSIRRKVTCVCLLIGGMFLLGQPPPEHGYTGPFEYLAKLIPSYYPGGLGEHFWLGIGSVMIIFALDNCRMLQIPFEWNFSQYLGDISFGVYAMHNTINWALYMSRIEPWRAHHLGNGYWSGLPGIILNTIVILWAADYFTRADDWMVWFGKWLETKLFVKWE